ncbi:MAG: hypothetical protein WC612_07515 [Bdellovibrionales bacterium]
MDEQTTNVIPLKSGIQRRASARHKTLLRGRRRALDSGFRRNDDR